MSILRPSRLLRAIRRQKHKSKRAHARNYNFDNFECDWLIELSDNHLASEVVENRSFFKPITIEEIVIFMINRVIVNKTKFLDWRLFILFSVLLGDASFEYHAKLSGNRCTDVLSSHSTAVRNQRAHRTNDYMHSKRPLHFLLCIVDRILAGVGNT